MSFIYGILLFITATINLIKLIDKGINIFLLKLHKTTEESNLKQGLMIKEHLHFLTPHEFEEWCGEFLKRYGYEEIQVALRGSDEGKDIICFKGGKKVYVECKRYSPNPFGIFKVDIDVVSKLVGAMIHDGVSNGILITTGIVKNEVYEYIRSLNDKISIEVIDGDKLVAMCNQQIPYGFTNA